jgi:hypothetical protein
MSGYTKWDRAAYIERVDGEQEAERRVKALMARQSGHRLAEERKRHGLTQAQLAQAMGVTPGRVPRSSAANWPPSKRSPATSKHSADGSTWSPASATTPSPSPLPKQRDWIPGFDEVPHPGTGRGQ